MPRLKPHGHVAAFAALRIPGRPAPKGSRTTVVTKSGRRATRPASKYEKPWIQAVQSVAFAHRQRWQDGRTLPAPYQVTLRFYLHQAADPTHPWASLGDLDKLVRATLDGLVFGQLLTDDRHVTRLIASKTPSPGFTGCVATILSPRSPA